MKCNLFVRMFVLFVLASGVYAVAQDSPMTNITGGGTKGAVPVFTAAHKIGNSPITLDSSGDADFAHSIIAAGNITADGTVYADGYVEPTDGVYSTSGYGYFGSYLYSGDYVESPYVYGTSEGSFGTVYSGYGSFDNTGDGDGIFAYTAYDDSYSYPVGGQATNSSGTSFEYSFFNYASSPVEYGDSLGDTVAVGTKSAAVPLKNGKMVKVYSQESPQVWFEDFGSAKLVGGVATVKLESKFAQLVDTKVPYHVFLTPDGDCPGLYVAQKDRNSFEVREVNGGHSNVEFDYRISALRNGYENLRLEPAVMPTMQKPHQRPAAPTPAKP